jgi:glycogen debranching enzyme
MFISDDVLDGLWGGVFYKKQAERVINRLRQSDMNTPKGLRTRSSLSRQFRVNGPRAYHNGLIWLHRNRIAAEGFERYGYYDFAQEIDYKIAKVEMRHGRIECIAAGRDGRLRQYHEQGTPAACKPQAWAVHGTLARTVLA